MIKLYFFFFLSFICFNISFESYIIYPFKKSTKENKPYPENLLQNDLEVTLQIGTPPQNIDMNLRSKIYTFFVASSEVNLPYKTFNEKESSSLVKISKKESNFTNMEYSKGLKISETIYVDGKAYKGVTLMLGTALIYKESGALGLRLINSHEYSDDLSFIYQLKKLADLDSYSFSLRYNSDDEGELIIGAYPHTYNNKFKENNFFYSKAGSNKYGVNWVLNFDIIRYNSKSLSFGTKKGLINIEYGLIQAPYRYKNFFKTNFYGDKCQEKFNAQRNVSIIHCNSNFDITSFKDISFELKDIETVFTLTYKDLFIKYNNEYIFGIVFDEDVDEKDPTWILGKPFMKKYELVYDLDRKIIGLYKEGKINSEGKTGVNVIFIILLVILIIVVIGLVYFIIYYLRKPKRKAYELNDENFEYEPSK